MGNDDLNYYRRRAAAELAQARLATRPEAVAAHSELAEAYLARVASVEQAGRTKGDIHA